MAGPQLRSVATPENPLVMLHGMVDTKVDPGHRPLTQRLIEMGKTGWGLASYPVKNHGFERPDSWTDEYGRIFQLFESTIGQRGSKAKRQWSRRCRCTHASPLRTQRMARR